MTEAPTTVCAWCRSVQCDSPITHAALAEAQVLYNARVAVEAERQRKRAKLPRCKHGFTFAHTKGVTTPCPGPKKFPA